MSTKKNKYILLLVFVAVAITSSVTYDLSSPPAEPNPPRPTKKINRSHKVPVATPTAKPAIVKANPLLKPTGSNTSAPVISGIKERKTLIQEKDEYYIGEYIIDREKSTYLTPHLVRPKEKFIDWSLQFGGSISGKVLIAGNQLCFGTYDFQAFAIETKSGNLLFQTKLISQPIGNPQRHQDNFLIPQRNGQVTAFSTKDYGIKWNHRSAIFKQKEDLDISITSVKVFGDLFYVSKHWGNLYISNAMTGLMYQDVGVPYESRINLPAVKTKAGILYSNVAGEIHCFNDDGSKRWQHTIEAGYPTSMLLQENNLVILTTEKTLISLNLKTKTNNWTRKLVGHGYDSITLNNGNLYILAKDAYSIDPENGNINWQAKAKSSEGFCRGSAVFQGQTALFALEQNGRLCKINIGNGAIIKQHHFNEAVRNPLQKDQQRIYLSTLEKRLYAINIKKFK